MIRSLGAALVALIGLLGCSSPSPQAPSSLLARNAVSERELEEAVWLAERAQAERLILATDPLERTVGSIPMIESLLQAERHDDLFLLGDSAFEQEARSQLGAGPGSRAVGSLHAPATQRIHSGHLGGFDASSCRSCHFGGGPDGAGTSTQITFFRGDGREARSAIRRDPPHVMGLGYLQIAARQIQQQLEEIRAQATRAAESTEQAVTLPLRASGVDYGEITAYPDGRIDTGGIDGVSSDLVVRPFGHKGRYADLLTLGEDSLQNHFGIQSPGREYRLSRQAKTHLGPGPAYDRDGDGIEHEVPQEHALLLAIYMGMLPTPEVRPPSDPRLQQAWARGQGLFESTGCADCHRPRLLLDHLELVLEGRVRVAIDLAEHGLEPKPRRTDFSPDPDGAIAGGIPIYAYTDLKRHDLGPALADPVDEPLPPAHPDSPTLSVGAGEWLTRPLWGLADTAPFLHDGRATTLHEAISWHGGDAAASSSAFEQLSESAQADLIVFLNSLTRPQVVLVE